MKDGKNRNDEADKADNEEVNAVRFALDHWQNLGCEGLAIRIQPERTIGAIAIWEELNASTALVHFEKGFVRYRGIYKIINQETAKTLRDRYTCFSASSSFSLMNCSTSPEIELAIKRAIVPTSGFFSVSGLPLRMSYRFSLVVVNWSRAE